MGWLRALGKLLRAEFFSSWQQSILSCIAIIAAVLTGFGLVFKVADVGSKFAPEQSPFLSYVWTTFVFGSLGLASSAILLQRLLRRHEEIARLSSRIDRAMILQHNMAETVRMVVAKKGANVDLNACLDRVLGAGLREYLRTRLGDRKIHCTVKSISRPRAGAGFQLTDVFRDDGQSATTRPLGGPDAAEDNYIYLRFRNAGIEDAKQVYIADVNSAGALRSLTERAHQRGYRTVLAFPLNQPALDPQLGMDRLVGFLGIDSPDPHAFDELFKFCPNGGPSSSAAGSDGVFKPLDELNFLYALADSVATILMIVQSQSAPGAPNNGR